MSDSDVYTMAGGNGGGVNGSMEEDAGVQASHHVSRVKVKGGC